MRLRLLILVWLVMTAYSARAAEPISIAVMEFSSKGGVTPDQMDALSDLLSNQIRSLGNFKVIGKADIRSLLTMEEQRQRLSTCDDQSCLAEIGGALGAGWVVMGNVSLFGKTYLLNLKLVDVRAATVAGGVSRSIKGGEDELLAALPSATKQLFDSVAAHFAPAPEASPSVPLAAVAVDKTPPEAAPADGLRRWSVWLALSGLSLSLIDDQEDPNSTCATNDLKDGRVGFGLAATVGYRFNPWLSLLGRLGGEYVFGSRAGASRRRLTVEPGLGLKITVPLESWVEPVAEGTVGVAFMNDDSQEGGSNLVTVSGTGLALHTAVGADFRLAEAWSMGVRGGLAFRHYFSLDENGDSTSAQATVLGVFGAISFAWVF